MSNIISYNQLIQMYRDFVDAHYFLKDFGNGPTSEIGTSREMKYPMLWTTHRTPSDIAILNKTAIPEFTITFIVVDQINNQKSLSTENGTDSDNQQEILSDTFQIIQDLVTYHQTTLNQFGVQLIEENITVEAIYDEMDDKVTGWVADFRVRLKHSNCVTPMGSIVLTVPATSNISLQYLTCSNLNTCETFITAIDNLQTQIDNIIAGSVCDVLSGCTIIQDIQNGISTLSGTTNTLQNGISTLSGTTNTLQNEVNTLQNEVNALSGLTSQPYDLILSITDEVSNITTGTTMITFYTPRAFTLTNVRATLTTAGTTASVFNINKNGTTILSTKITIDSTENKSVDATIQPVLSSTSISENDKITIDIDTAGTSAKGAKIYLKGTTLI